MMSRVAYAGKDKRTAARKWTEQHHDHIWLTFSGEGWAIRRIVREDPLTNRGKPVLLYLWRGYWPDIVRLNVDVSEVDWPLYCDHAVKLLEEAYG